MTTKLYKQKMSNHDTNAILKWNEIEFLLINQGLFVQTWAAQISILGFMYRYGFILLLLLHNNNNNNTYYYYYYYY